MRGNPNIISVGENRHEVDPHWWGSVDWARHEAEKAESRRLRDISPLAEPPRKLTSIGGLYTTRADQRRARVDAILEAHGIDPYGGRRRRK